VNPQLGRAKAVPVYPTKSLKKEAEKVMKGEGGVNNR
jgi:hypothetical protein